MRSYSVKCWFKFVGKIRTRKRIFVGKAKTGTSKRNTQFGRTLFGSSVVKFGTKVLSANVIYHPNSESTIFILLFRYILEIQRLEEERKSLKTEKEKLGEAFESKLRRAQTLYETELSAAKCLYSKELEAFQGHEEALKDELIGR